MPYRRIGALRVDPENGIIYGIRGRPVGRCDTSGYVQFTYFVDGRSRIFSAHRTIWEQVNGPIPPGMEVNHKNGVKTDNRISNLELMTHQQNIKHAYENDLKTNRGVHHPRSILNDDKVRELRRLRADGVDALVLAAQFGISRRNVYDVTNRRTWTHVEDD